ncbi:MAG: hypothetical protein V4555_15580 [Acidobacteriota bacterium]
MRLRTGQVLRVVTAAVVLTGTSLVTSSCGNFFVCEGKPACPSSGGGSGSGAGTGDYVYVSNSSSSATSLTAFNASTGSPVALSASPISLGYSTNAMAMKSDNTLLFASSLANSAIYAYSISSAGGLTNPNGTQAVLNSAALAMDISPDGKYLYVLTGNGTYVLQEFSIGTNGVLTPGAALPLLLVNGTAAVVKVAPTSNFLVVAMGTAGDEIVPLSSDLFNTGSVNPSTIPEPTGSVGDFGVAIDANNNIYLARTGTIAVYSATSNGVPAPVSNTTANAQTGTGDHSIVIAGSYLYVANQSASAANGTISGFSFTAGGVLTPLSGSPYNAPADVDQLVVDNTGKYIVAAGAGATGIEEFAIGTSGALTASSTTAATGSSGSAALVMVATH